MRLHKGHATNRSVVFVRKEGYMSREIKFRAWTGTTMMYQDKQYLGSFIRRVVMQVMLDPDIQEPRDHESYLPKGSKIDDYLLQYTGLKDRNGKEIYEGDIVKGNHEWEEYGDELQVVKYVDGVWSYSYVLLEYVEFPERHWEVVGNIYENPDLVTKR